MEAFQGETSLTTLRFTGPPPWGSRPLRAISLNQEPRWMPSPMMAGEEETRAEDDGRE